MKRGRDENKVMGPLFPRLHVNDADKGGLRAPPRNKMALYELFSIPSQRSSSEAGAALSRQPHQAGSSAVSGQGCGLERSVSSPFCVPQTSPHMAEKFHLHSPVGVNQNATRISHEGKSLKHGLYRMAEKVHPQSPGGINQNTVSISHEGKSSKHGFYRMEEKVHPHSQGGISQNTTRISPEGKSSKHGFYRMADKVHLQSLGRISQNASGIIHKSKSSKHDFCKMASSAVNEDMDVVCSSLRPDDLSVVKTPFGKKSEEDDDFRVPTCTQPGKVLQSDKDCNSIDREGTTHSHVHSLSKFGSIAHGSQSHIQSTHGMHLERHDDDSLMPQRCKDRDKGKSKETLSLHKNMDSDPHPSVRRKSVNPLKIHRLSSNGEHATFSPNRPSILQSGSQCQEPHSSLREARCLNNAEFKEKQVIPNDPTESCSRLSLDKSLLEHSFADSDRIVGEMMSGVESAKRTGSSNDVNNVDQLGNDNESQTPEDANRTDDASDTSMVDFVPGTDICPDDVVNLIGPKHFWKARRAIVNQQRLFAVQVFELHRLIKVQKLIAGSENLLPDDPPLFPCSPKSPVKDPSPSFLPKHQSRMKQNEISHKANESECAAENTESINLVVKPQTKVVSKQKKDESHLVIHDGDCTTGNTGGRFPLSGEQKKSPIHGIQTDGSEREKSPIHGIQTDGSKRVHMFPTTSDNSSGAWCVHPPGNQWLIPVMSPSEGLIYKPYTGPCPPAAAFMPPVYAGCGPVSLSPGAGEIMKPAFGIPIHHQQHAMGVIPGTPAVAANYFPGPYGVQVVNPLISSSPIELARSMTGPQPSGQHEQQSWSSCNMSNPRREATSHNAQKVQLPEEKEKENDVQGSTASCAGDRSHREKDGLPQLPIASSQESGRPPHVHSRDQQSRVIKVIPHNPKSATESVARIFRSIQRERQQYDSV